MFMYMTAFDFCTLVFILLLYFLYCWSFVIDSLGISRLVLVVKCVYSQPSALIGALAFKGLKFCSWKLCYTPSRERQSRLEEEMLEVGWVDPLHELVYAVPIV